MQHTEFKGPRRRKAPSSPLNAATSLETEGCATIINLTTRRTHKPKSNARSDVTQSDLGKVLLWNTEIRLEGSAVGLQQQAILSCHVHDPLLRASGS